MPSRAHRAPPDVSANEFSALFEALSQWGRWGPDDDRGALNLITPERIAGAVGLVREGTAVTLSLPMNTNQGEDNPSPADHHMTALGAVVDDGRALQFNKDYVGVDYHNDGHTHIDALSHVAYAGLLYNGVPQDAVTGEGARVGSIEVLKDGLVGRAVLLDIPRARDVPWLEPGDHIFSDDLDAAESKQGVTVGQGDILLVRTGHAHRLKELGPWDTPHAKAGLHPTALSFIADRDIAVLGSDGNSDTAPSTTEGVAFPIHVLTIAAMGIHLLDYLQFESVRKVCERTGRWEFLFMGAPLRIVHGTGSPLNPIAIF